GQRLDHLALHLDCVFLAHDFRFRLSPASRTDAQCRSGLRCKKVLRTRWLTRPGLAVTHRKEPTPESVSRIRMPQRRIDRARLGLSGDALGDSSRLRSVLAEPHVLELLIRVMIRRRHVVL